MKKIILLCMCLFISALTHAVDINFPDANFKAALLATIPPIDTSGDGEISIAEAEVVEYLSLREKGISDLTGIEHFVNLIQLDAGKNELTSVDISNNINLESLTLDRNQITGPIDVSNNIKLIRLQLILNNITSIDISNNVNLTFINVGRNDLSGVFDVSNCIKLFTLSLDYNDITDVDVSNNPLLQYLYLAGNELTNIDLSNNPLLFWLYLQGNKLVNVDLSNQTLLTNLKIAGSYYMTSLDLRANTKIVDLSIVNSRVLETVYATGLSFGYKTVLGEDVIKFDLRSGAASLKFICADQEYLNDIYSLLEVENRTECLLSSDCDDPHNRIQGNITFDVDNDGCGDGDDVPFNEGLRFTAISLTGGAPIWAYPNEDGQYTLHAADDTYFFAPVLENINYFTINPPVIFPPIPTVIPAGLPTLTTDYCIQPLGTFNDLEVNIVPISRARPGFNATYLITYKNIGTTTQSGTVTLDYQDDVINYVSSTPSANSNSNGQLSWNFNNLQPMETVEIPLTLILNTPTDSPALNGGDILDFTASITGATDETPDNNVMTLAQEVVNSYDPNDKTCLEGDILDPDAVGGYLHYLIRFENEGSAEAVNIRVVDVIDTAKLDIESFVPLKSSHSYTTTITNDNEIEFSFRNINLPFDDANNDGYVLFKIKSKDSLVEGDEIVNRAAIYFDFNFPIITENSVVTVKREVIEEPDFYDYFTLSPNPTTGILNLGVLDDSISISYILLYDMGGNVVSFYYGTTQTMNVSYLFPNTYFIKVITNKGELAAPFIKL